MFIKPKIKREIYLDHAATTYCSPEVVNAMLPYFSEVYGNPSSLYHKGREANSVLNDSRRTVAKLVNALPENIIFTGGGSESDNMAIYGIARAHESKGKHIVTSAVEHRAVLHPLEDLQKQGWEVTYLKVDEQGFINVDELVKSIRPDTVLVSIMYANNEVGTIEPIADIGREILKYRKENNTPYPFFHSDACQAAGYINLNVEKLHVDLMTVNGSKMYGPKGVGMLYVRRGTRLKPLIVGGGQERHLRAGTENIPAIVGFAKAFELVQQQLESESKRVGELRNFLWKELQEKIPKLKLNGPEMGDKRLPNNLNVTFIDVEGEAMLLYLDEYGIMCSTGSACTSKSLDPSHVLLAMGLPYEYSHGSLRFTFGHCNTKKDIEYMMKYLPDVTKQLREISPVNMRNVKHAKYKK